MSLFDDYPHFTENDWRNEMDAADLAEMRESRRQQNDVEIYTSRPCCDIPSNYQYIPASGLYDPLTGVAEEPFYQCSCGGRICESDYANICKWFESKNQTEPDAVPIEIDERTRIKEKRIA